MHNIQFLRLYIAKHNHKKNGRQPLYHRVRLDGAHCVGLQAQAGLILLPRPA